MLVAVAAIVVQCAGASAVKTSRGNSRRLLFWRSRGGGGGGGSDGGGNKKYVHCILRARAPQAGGRGGGATEREEKGVDYPRAIRRGYKPTIRIRPGAPTQFENVVERAHASPPEIFPLCANSHLIATFAPLLRLRILIARVALFARSS